jgi:hypothetical protein
MHTNSTNTNNGINSTLSFRPLMRAWEKVTKEGREGSRKQYSELLEKVNQYPELTEPIRDLSILEKHKDIIDQMMTTLFPVTLSDSEDLYGVSIPFQFKMVYSSQLFRNIFLDEKGEQIMVPDNDTGKKLSVEKMACAYQLVLARLYDVKIPGQITTIHPYPCPYTGLDRYMELELDTRFIEVKIKGELPELPKDCKYDCFSISDILTIPNIEQLLPLSLFEFEGMVILRIREVTEREVLNNIRNRLFEIHSFSDSSVFHELQKQVQNLVGVPGIESGIKPFFKVNNHLVLTEMHISSKMASKEMPSLEMMQKMHQNIVAMFKESKDILIVDDITEETVKKYPFLVMLFKYGFKNAIVCPLFTNTEDGEEMIGVLLIISRTKGTLNKQHVHKIEPALPLFKLALEKSQENLDHQVDRVIKDQFTAVQDAVEWRFTEAALNYLTKKSKGEQTKIEPIIFEGVYPLYGAIDIRNSSIERNNAIQLDLLEQLNLANSIIQQARKENPFPLLDETSFKLQKYIHAVTNILFADEEITILQFLKTELVDLFRHLQSILPALNESITRYFSAIDSPVEMVYKHRKEYEESIMAINNEVARFIDGEQKAAQKIFPHYFERFVTDGVDFNIYIGQSISPHRKFDFFYLKNLKIWQLSTLVKAARLTQTLQKELPMPLQTTQLILANSHPISISFRTAERKFDVDGAYNIRYEIVKKRIDKVHIKNSNERFTQPGMLAIVYSQPQEANEYLGYIEYLQNQGLLKDKVERFDLEELQGVSGLKGLRVGINYEEIPVAGQDKTTKEKSAVK